LATEPRYRTAVSSSVPHGGQGRDIMADEINNNSSGGNGIYFIVGALVVAVLVIGYFVMGGNFGGGSDVNIKIDPPKAEAPKN
jgi:hypothetical protein